MMLKYKKYSLTFILILLGFTQTFAQKGKKEQAPNVQSAIIEQYRDSLYKYEMQLKDIADTIMDAKFQYNRIIATTKFIPLLVKTLKFPGSFSYPFDSLKFMKKLTPADQSFRLYNWILKYDDGTFRYYGAIQRNRPDSFQLIPLRDYSEKLDTTLQTVVLDNNNWFGTYYYDIIQTEHKKKKQYFLLGWDGHNHVSDKKIIDVLTIDKKKAYFGAPVFVMNDSVTQTRVFYEFSNDAVMLLKYVPEHKIIVLDHLVPKDRSGEGFYFTYVPDGTYNYFEFKKGKWYYKEQFFENMKKPVKEAGDYEDMRKTAPKAKTEKEMKRKK